MLNEKSDVYSFGILIMELISGRSPVDYGRPQGEVSFSLHLMFDYDCSCFNVIYGFFAAYSVVSNDIIAGKFGGLVEIHGWRPKIRGSG